MRVVRVGCIDSEGSVTTSTKNRKGMREESMKGDKITTLAGTIINGKKEVDREYGDQR